MNKLRIISWNVNGIRAAVKKGFYEKVVAMNPDILCLQEIKSSVEIVHELAASIDGYYAYANAAEKKGYSGTAILSRKEPLNVTYDMGVAEHDMEGRVIAAEYHSYYLVNVYVPNSGQDLRRLDYRKGWDADFRNYLDALQKRKPVILTGDLNVAHEPIDLARPEPNYNKTAGYTQVEIDGFKKLLESNFIDTFRHFHPDQVAYTFWNQRFKARERNVGWRIDYFMAGQGLMDKITDSRVLNEVQGSDHCPILLEINE